MARGELDVQNLSEMTYRKVAKKILVDKEYKKVLRKNYSSILVDQRVADFLIYLVASWVCCLGI